MGILKRLFGAKPSNVSIPQERVNSAPSSTNKEKDVKTFYVLERKFVILKSEPPEFEYVTDKGGITIKKYKTGGSSGRHDYFADGH